mgnify:CR=1 FL=1
MGAPRVGAKSRDGAVGRVVLENGVIVFSAGPHPAREASGTERTLQGRFVVDATGRDTLLANQFGIKRRNRRHNSAAIPTIGRVTTAWR